MAGRPPSENGPMVGTQVLESPQNTPTPEAPSFEYNPSSIDPQFQLGVSLDPMQPTLSRRATAKMLANQDYAEAQAVAKKAGAATDLSSPVLQSIADTHKTLQDRQAKLQQFSDHLDQMSNQLSGNTPQQATGLPNLPMEDLIAVALGTLVSPGHADAFIRSLYQTADASRQKEFENTLTQWNAKMGNVQSQQASVQNQMGHLSTQIDANERAGVTAMNAEEARQQRAATEQDREEQNTRAGYERANQHNNIAGIRDWGEKMRQKGLLQQSDVDNDIEYAKKRIATAHSLKVLPRIMDFSKMLDVRRREDGSIPMSDVPMYEQQRALMAQQLSADGDIVRPEELGPIPTKATMKGQEFAVKFPYLKETERVRLANLVASVQEKRAAIEALKAHVDISRDNALTSRLDSMISEYNASLKQPNDEIGKKIRDLKNHKAGLENQLKGARPSKAKTIQSDIDKIDGQIGDWEQQRPQPLDGSISFTLPSIPLPGKAGKPARLTGTIGSGTVDGHQVKVTPG